MKMYKTAGAYTPVDGIIAVDTHALVSAMNILGDVNVDGTTFTTKVDPRCNCPQVIYELETIADQPTNKIVANRKGIIGDLMYAIMTKAFSSSQKLYWGPLFQTMLSEMNQKHVLFYMDDANAQAGFEGLDAAGRVMPFQGDYFMMNEANFGGAKSNMFVSEDVTQDYNIQSDGSIVKTVTVNNKGVLSGDSLGWTSTKEEGSNLIVCMKNTAIDVDGNDNDLVVARVSAHIQIRRRARGSIDSVVSGPNILRELAKHIGPLVNRATRSGQAVSIGDPPIDIGVHGRRHHANHSPLRFASNVPIVQGRHFQLRRSQHSLRSIRLQWFDRRLQRCHGQTNHDLRLQ